MTENMLGETEDLAQLEKDLRLRHADEIKLRDEILSRVNKTEMAIQAMELERLKIQQRFIVNNLLIRFKLKQEDIDETINVLEHANVRIVSFSSGGNASISFIDLDKLNAQYVFDIGFLLENDYQIAFYGNKDTAKVISWVFRQIPDLRFRIPIYAESFCDLLWYLQQIRFPDYYSYEQIIYVQDRLKEQSILNLQ